ncbi:hypothetical protein CO151_06605 [bacterium CG_4_9_14_3_um_filter_65_15]|nr:MAG: hypothetical protein CO151_06605 [bacterium CG_4_9_14_3_um_filter_65_15]
MTPFERAVVIVNPVSGQARGLRLGQNLSRALEEHDVFCALRVTSGRGDAENWARQAAADGFDLIVAIGGDGTIAEVVSGQARSGAMIPIAVVPVGTANVVALALALPFFAGMALDTILHGRRLDFDVGYIPDHDHHFLLMSAIGYPAKVIQDSPRRLKNLFGVFTYMAAAVRNALNQDQVRIFVEDETGLVREFEGHTVLLSNIGKIGDLNLKVTPDTSAHDGRFDVTVISSRSLWDVIAILFRMLTWRYRPAPRMHHFQAESVVIATDPAVGVQVDGEELGQTPLSARVVPGAVRMVVGSRYRPDAEDGGFGWEFKLPRGWLRRAGSGA